MPPAAEAEPDAIVPQSFALQALANAGFNHQVDSALFQHSRPYAIFDILAAAALQDYRLDASQVQQMGEHQAGRSCPDDTHLSSHAFLTYQGRVELK